MPDPQDAAPGGFPGVDPQKVALIHAIVQASQGNPSNVPAAPQSAPQAGPLPPSSPFDLASTVKGVASIPEYQQQSQALNNIGTQEQGIRDKMAAMPIPKMGFQPTFEHGHFLHNLGQALLSVAASTRPGQAVQDTVYGPGISKYEAGQKTLANQLAALKAQEEVPTEQLRAITGLTGAASLGSYRGGELANASERNNIAKQKADQQGTAISQRYSVELQRLQQGAQRLTLDQQNLQLKQWFEKGILEATNARIQAGQDMNSARIDAQQDMKAAMSQNQWALQHPFLNAVGIAPEINAAPGASTNPVNTKPTAKPKAGGKQKGDPLGIL